MSTDVDIQLDISDDDDLHRVMRKIQDVALELGISRRNLNVQFSVGMMDVVETQEDADRLLEDALNAFSRKGRCVSGWTYHETNGVSETDHRHAYEVDDA